MTGILKDFFKLGLIMISIGIILNERITHYGYYIGYLPYEYTITNWIIVLGVVSILIPISTKPLTLIFSFISDILNTITEKTFKKLKLEED